MSWHREITLFWFEIIQNNIKEILNSLKNIINSDTLIVFEMANESDANVDGFKIIKEKNYGIKKIVYYKYLIE